jgi:acid phosphatase type 7
MHCWMLVLCYMLMLLSMVVVHAKHKDSSYAPEQIHLSFGTADCTAVTVSWVTRHEADSLVLFGTGQELSSEATGSSRRYTFNKSAPYKSPVLHSATLTNLAPSTVYHYECGDKQLGLSARSSFTTPPSVGDGLHEQGGYVLGLVGDLGQTEDSAVTVRHIQEEPLPLAVLHAGDLSYADCDQGRQVHCIA